jgi:hypothetical protein
MHVVLGDGEMTRKELTETLKDLWDKAGEEPFWFILQGKSEPTDTDQALVSWLHKNEIYYEVVTDDEDSLSDIYTQAQETHTAKRLAQKVGNLLQTKPEDDEDALILALFVSEDPAAEEDRWLNTVIRSAMDEGFRALALNDGLVEVQVDGGAPAEEEEAVAEAPKPKKAPAKKAAAKAVEAESDGEGDAEGTLSVVGAYTRAELEDMDMAALKEIAATKGIELPPRTRMNTYIDHILGEVKSDAPAVEVSEPPVTVVLSEPITTNGDLPPIDQIVEQVLDRLAALLQQR